MLTFLKLLTGSQGYKSCVDLTYCVEMYHLRFSAHKCRFFLKFCRTYFNVPTKTYDRNDEINVNPTRQAAIKFRNFPFSVSPSDKLCRHEYFQCFCEILPIF